MGWSNFIIIPSLNIAVEVSRDLHDLEDYEEKAFDYLTSDAISTQCMIGG